MTLSHPAAAVAPPASQTPAWTTSFRAIADLSCESPPPADTAAVERLRSDVVSAIHLEGEAVRGPGGEMLGRVRHTVLDLRGGRIAFIAMDVKGMDRRRLCAVPWPAFGPDPAVSGLALPHTLEALRRAPTFDADAWPSLGDPEWLEAVYRFFFAPQRA